MGDNGLPSIYRSRQAIQLPVECLLRVLGFVPDQSLPVLQRVCRSWGAYAASIQRERYRREYSPLAFASLTAVPNDIRWCEEEPAPFWFKEAPFSKEPPKCVEIGDNSTFVTSLKGGSIGIFSSKTQTCLKAISAEKIAGFSPRTVLTFMAADQNGHFFTCTQPGGLSCHALDPQIAEKLSKWRRPHLTPIALVRLGEQAELLGTAAGRRKVYRINPMSGKTTRTGIRCAREGQVQVTATALGPTVAVTSSKKVKFWRIEQRADRKKKVVYSPLGSLVCNDSSYQWKALPAERKWYAIGLPTKSTKDPGILYAQLEGKKEAVIVSGKKIGKVVRCARAAATPDGIVVAFQRVKEGITVQLFRRHVDGLRERELSLKSPPLVALELVPLFGEKRSAILLFSLSPNSLTIREVAITRDVKMKVCKTWTMEPACGAHFSGLSMRLLKSGVEAIALTDRALIYRLHFLAS